MESETFYQDVLTRKEHIFSWSSYSYRVCKVFEVWVESLKSPWAPSILEKTLKSLLNPWKVLEFFPNDGYYWAKSRVGLCKLWKNFQYVHVTVVVVSQTFIWLFIYYTVLEIKSPYFKCWTSKPVNLVALLNHWLLIKINNQFACFQPITSYDIIFLVI